MTISFHPSSGLIVTFTPMEKIWGLHGDFHIPADHVSGAWAGMPKSTWNELRLPGSFVPGLIKAGTYKTPRGWEYWYVTREKRYPVSIELTGERYARLVLGVSDPALISTSGLRMNHAPPGIQIDTLRTS